MKVSLINFTDDALNLLLRTKNTRLSYADDPAGWTEEQKAEHLTYMLQTIKSSWEFVAYTFRIEGVTRAFTHELVRHRHGSYAQQSMRVIDAREAAVTVPAAIQEDEHALQLWAASVDVARATYGRLIDGGFAAQDARGLLPTNVQTAILAQFNLRTLHEMSKVRLCTRAAGEFQDAMRAMRALVVARHPWTAPFIQVHCVAEGTCAFPRYGKTECPVYDPAMDQSAVKAAAAEKFWSLRYYAAPRAEGGMAMKQEGEQ